MEYSREIIINRSKEDCIRLISNPENMQKWQPTMTGYEFLEGEFGKPGSKMRMDYLHGKRKMSMVETIIKIDGGLFEATYEAPGVYNHMKSNFESIDENTSKWTTHQNFKFTSLMMKIIGFFMKGAFPKETEKIQKNFKEFAESEA